MSKYNYLKLAILGLSISLFSIIAKADDPDDFMRQLELDYNAFKQSVEDDYLTFRDQLNEEYARALAEPWKLIKGLKPVTAPPEPSPKPDINFDPQKEKDRQPDVIKYDEEFVPYEIPPAPQPYNDIPDVPKVPGVPDISVTLYGTPIKLSGVASPVINIPSSDSRGFAEGWRSLSKKEWNNLINDCLSARKNHKLSDWAYLRLLDKVASKICGENNNKQTLLTGYLFNQSGYDMRFCLDHSGRLHLLLATSGTLYGRNRFSVDGKYYYAYTTPGSSVYICDFRTPGEKPMSLAVREIPELDFVPAGKQTIPVHGHPELQLSASVNKNLLDFYSDFPDSALEMSEYSRWSIQANTPASKEIKEQVYPTLRKAVEGLNQSDAVNLLLKVAQSFEYGYDEELWGHDRVFWMEESWHYPYSDCEDHAINFTRLVRDILGLDCCLIYYPGHLSSGVSITDGSGSGDYLEHRGKKYIVCDATYFYADAGHTAPSNKGEKAVVIPI